MSSIMFEAREINVKSTTLKCLMCDAEGLGDNIVVLPAELPPKPQEAGGIATPSKVIILCKKCLTADKLNYEDYLKLVNLPRL